MMQSKTGIFGVLFVSAMLATASNAGEADVTDVRVTKSGDKYTFHVTVSHEDEGWDHYANKWEVVGSDGTVYGTRVLAHPHVNEQPFTRSGTFEIPQGVTSVIVRAGDSIHALGGAEMTVDLPE